MNPLVILLLLLSWPCFINAQASLAPMGPESINAHIEVALNHSDLAEVVAIAVDKEGIGAVFKKAL